MKKKLFIAIYVLGIIVTVMLLNTVVTTIRQTPATPLTAEQNADLSISQFTERQNSTLDEASSSSQSFFTTTLFAQSYTPVPGCSLHFSYVPINKAVEPHGNAVYAIKIVNQGKDTCKNASLSLYYQDKESFASSTPKPTASDYYWSIGDLGSGNVYVLSLTTKTTLANGQEMLPEGCVTADNSSDVCSQTAVFGRKGASISTTLSSKLHVPAIFGFIWGSPFHGKEFGIWVWDSPLKMSNAYASEVISTLKKNGFNTIYLTIDDYVPITEIHDEKEKAARTSAYMNSLSLFIQGAKSAGIAVDVVGGAKDWAVEENRWKGYALIDFVKHYNQAYPAYPIHGLQYDVEPYLLPEYNVDKAKTLKQFVAFVDESARQMKDVPARFSIVIPHFYDSTQQWTPSFSYNNVHGYAFTQLLHVLAQKNDTEMIIMSYRNFFDGDNGVKEISEPEMKEATEGGYETKIILAQETGNVSPEYVTYYNYPKSSLFEALSEIQKYFKRYQNYGGVAVHYFDSFLKLN